MSDWALCEYCLSLLLEGESERGGSSEGKGESERRRQNDNEDETGFTVNE